MHPLILSIALLDLGQRFRWAIRLVARVSGMHLGPSLFHPPALVDILLEVQPGGGQDVAPVDQGAHEARVDRVRGDGF